VGRGPVAMRSRVASASSCSSIASVTSASACSSRGIHRSLVAQSRYRVASGSASTTRSAFAAAACRTAASRAAPCARRVRFTQAGSATRADGHLRQAAGCNSKARRTASFPQPGTPRSSSRACGRVTPRTPVTPGDAGTSCAVSQPVRRSPGSKSHAPKPCRAARHPPYSKTGPARGRRPGRRDRWWHR